MYSVNKQTRSFPPIAVDLGPVCNSGGWGSMTYTSTNPQYNNTK